MSKKLLFLMICSLFILSSCSLPGLGGQSKGNVKITALSTTESQIMAHMIRLKIEHDTDGKIKPTIVNNLGSSTIQHQALINGDANISSTRYTGTDLVGALNMKPVKDPAKAMTITQQQFKKQFHQTWFDSYGFENTFAFMVTKETAKKYHLKTVSDLEKHSDTLRLGTDSTWIKREGDGYPTFKKVYGFGFNSVRPMQIGLVYDALKNNKLDVALGYTTDGRIAAYDLVVLKDDKKFFPPYDASALATDELLKSHPEIKTSLNDLTGQINTEEMQKLNYEADGKGKEPATVAEEFLKAHHYFNSNK